MEEFKNYSNAFSYLYEKTLLPGEIIIIKMPPVSPNKRGVNDIGWLAEDDITLYATLQSDPENDNTKWQEILADDEINKTTKAIKAVNSGDKNGYLIIRALLY